jgi:hypothetical protein
MIMNQSERRFFTTVYHLAQQSVEGFAFWKELLPHLKLQRRKYREAILFNEELLRIIITNTKRACVVTTFILCDNEGYGQQGHNVQQLLERCTALPNFDTNAEKRLLASKKTARRIEQIRILRNNLDAHHSASDEWKQRFGTLQNSEFEELISTIYGIVFRCNKAAGIRRVSEDFLREASTVYADRLLRALTKQLEDGCAGKGFVTVGDWESGDPSI